MLQFTCVSCAANHRLVLSVLAPIVWETATYLFYRLFYSTVHIVEEKDSYFCRGEALLVAISSSRAQTASRASRSVSREETLIKPCARNADARIDQARGGRCRQRPSFNKQSEDERKKGS